MISVFLRVILLCTNFFFVFLALFVILMTLCRVSDKVAFFVRLKDRHSDRPRQVNVLVRVSLTHVREFFNLMVTVYM